MTDENLLNLLRDVTVDRTSATSGNIRGAAALGKRIRRRRRTATALGSGLTVAGFAALITLASPGGQTVVQGATPAQTSAPNAEDPDPSAHDSNVRVLQQDLGGSTRWDVAYNQTPTGGTTSGPLVRLGSDPAAHSLPAGFVANSFVAVLPTAQKVACPPATVKVSNDSCWVQQPAGGGGPLMIDRRVQAAGANEEAVSAVTRLTYLRPDRTSVVLWLAVTGWSEHGRSDEQAAVQWLSSQQAGLVAAATDPALRVEPQDAQLFPVPTVSDFNVLSAQISNDESLRDRLGRAAGWQLIYQLDKDSHQDVVVAPLPGSPAAQGLPSGWSATGGATFAFGESCADKATLIQCSTESAPDGRTVQVERTDFPSTQAFGGDGIKVFFHRTDGEQSIASLTTSWPQGQGTQAGQQQAETWLNHWLDQLIATAQDPSLRKDRYPEPKTSCCGG